MGAPHGTQAGQLGIFNDMDTIHTQSSAATYKADYRAGCAAWQLLNEQQKAAWKIVTRTRTINGFNAFLSNWLHR
jgi:hypothetical protein